MNSDNVAYFDSFGVKHIPEELKNFKGNKYIKTNIYWNKQMVHYCADTLVLDLLILFEKVKVC